MSRLTIATSAKADSSGEVTFGDFGSPGPTTAWIVTAAVPLAPGTASFQAWRTTEVWATWLGSAAGGPLLVTGSQRLVVKGKSLVDTVTYRCVLTGQSLPEATAQGVSVAPISSSTLTKTTLTGTVTATLTGPVSFAAGSVVGVKGGQLSSTTIPLQATAPQLLVTTFGTGATGTVTLSANATLTNPANYKNLTLDASVILTAPWIVYVATTANLGTTTSAIANNGTTGGRSTAGAGGLAGSFFGGGNGGHTGPTGNPGTAPKSASKEGGPGGKGNLASSIGGAAGPPVTTPILFGTIQNYTFSGGGGGGGGTLGGGGGGGGVVMLAAKKITGAGNVKAVGGNSYRTSTDFGGGGGGGIALVYSHTSKTWSGKAIVTPGTTPTKPAASGNAGGKTVRKKYVGALFT